MHNVYAETCGSCRLAADGVTERPSHCRNQKRKDELTRRPGICELCKKDKPASGPSLTRAGTSILEFNAPPALESRANSRAQAMMSIPATQGGPTYGIGMLGNPIEYRQLAARGGGQQHPSRGTGAAPPGSQHARPQSPRQLPEPASERERSRSPSVDELDPEDNEDEVRHRARLTALGINRQTINARWARAEARRARAINP